jgi:hypothetical protein
MDEKNNYVEAKGLLQSLSCPYFLCWQHKGLKKLWYGIFFGGQNKMNAYKLICFLLERKAL